VSSSELPCAPISAVHHVALFVSDLARAEAFYGGLLGLAVRQRWYGADGIEPRSIWFDLGSDSFLAVELTREAKAAPRAETLLGWNLVALSIRCEDRATWRRRLTTSGFPVIQETEYTLYVRDPEGHRVGLSHWPKRAGASAATP
jgi:catechol 2,3-dioxygenase-like lactoylglutathione lyase family enzyme